jgi:hypothetical protein
MIHGVVSRNREATISLVIVNENRQTKLITALIDTGYTGFLSLPSEIITELNLPWVGIYFGIPIVKFIATLDLSQLLILSSPHDGCFSLQLILFQNHSDLPILSPYYDCHKSS